MPQKSYAHFYVQNKIFYFCLWRQSIVYKYDVCVFVCIYKKKGRTSNEYKLDKEIQANFQMDKRIKTIYQNTLIKHRKMT